MRRVSATCPSTCTFPPTAPAPPPTSARSRYSAPVRASVRANTPTWARSSSKRSRRSSHCSSLEAAASSGLSRRIGCACTQIMIRQVVLFSGAPRASKMLHFNLALHHNVATGARPQTPGCLFVSTASAPPRCSARRQSNLSISQHAGRNLLSNNSEEWARSAIVAPKMFRHPYLSKEF